MNAAPQAKQEIFSYVVDMIVNGELSLNDRVPTEHALAKRFSTNRMNAHYAIKMLERQGFVRRNRGEGTIVVRIPSAGGARHLANAFVKRVQVIASLSRSAGIHWSHATVDEMERVFNSHEMSILRHQLSEKPSRDELLKHLKESAKLGCCALVLLPETYDTNFFIEHVDLIFQYHTNVFMLDRGEVPLEGWPFHSIGFNPVGEGAMVAEYLYDHGYRDIAFWSWTDAPWHWVLQRQRGLELGLKRASIGSLHSRVLPVPPHELVSQLKARRTDQSPMAIVAPNDELAVHLLEVAQREGLSPPDDFALVGFDNHPRFREHQLTTVAPAIATIGERMGDMVSSQDFPKNSGDIMRIKVASSIVDGQTVGRVTD